MDDLVEQRAPLGTESLADAHLGASRLHAVADQAAQVDGGQEKEQQHQNGGHHQVFSLVFEAFGIDFSKEV